MKQYCLYIIKLFGFTIFVLTLVMVLMHSYVNYEIANFYSNSSETKVAVFGDSHATLGFDPEYYRGSKNYSSSGELLPITYNKLLIALDNSLNLDTVFLFVSYHSLTQAYENIKLENQGYINTFLPLFTKDYLKRTTFPEIWSAVVKNYISRDIDYKNLHGFYKMIDKTGVRPIELADLVGKHFGDLDSLVLSNNSLNALDNIKELCIINNIKLILVNSPVTREYLNFVPQAYVNDFKKRMKDTSISYWDFTQEKLTASHYLDYDHLNAKGARILTKKMFNK